MDEIVDLKREHNLHAPVIENFNSKKICHNLPNKRASVGKKPVIVCAKSKNVPSCTQTKVVVASQSFDASARPVLKHSCSLSNSSELENDEKSLPSTQNKKKPPDNLKPIDKQLEILQAVNSRPDLNTPVTIDIISECGRSTQLEPLPSNRSSAKYSSSNKLDLSSSSRDFFRKNSEIMFTNNKMVNQNPNLPDDVTNTIDQDLSDYDDLDLNDAEFNETEIFSVHSELQNVPAVAGIVKANPNTNLYTNRSKVFPKKLETITESSIQPRVVRIIPKGKAKPETNQSVLARNPSPSKFKPRVTPSATKPTQPVIPASAGPKDPKIIKNPLPNGIHKPSDLASVKSNKTASSVSSRPSPIKSTKSQPNLNRVPSSVKVDASKPDLSKKPSAQGLRKQYSELEKGGNNLAAPAKTEERIKSDEASSSSSDMVYPFNPEQAQPKSYEPVKPSIDEIFRLEINSNKMSLVERPPSARVNSASSAHSSMFSNATNQQYNSDIVNQQPIICDMFENYPQPYPSKTKDEVNNLINKPIPSKVQNKSLYPKKSTRKPQPKSGDKVGKSKTSAKSTKSTTKDTEKSQLESQDDIKLDFREDYSDDYSSEEEEKKPIYTSNSIKESVISEIDITTKRSLVTEANNEMLKSVVEKFEMLYEKYNELLTLEANSKRLKEIKNQMCDDMSRELDSINFEGISQDPATQARIKRVYSMMKQNSSSSESENNSRVDSNRTPTQEMVDQRPSLTRENSITIGSVKSKANIRNVYSIINSMSKTAPNHVRFDDDSDAGEVTIPPPSRNRTQPLPAKMVDKIASLVTPFLNSTQADYLKAQNEQDSQDENEGSINPNEELAKRREEINSITGLLDSLPRRTSVSGAGRSRKNSKDLFKFPDGFETENEFTFEWRRGQLIDSGANGKVYTAFLNTGNMVAVKQIEMDNTEHADNRKAYLAVREEVRILRDLDHENVVQFMGTTFQNNIVNIFMELIPGASVSALLENFGAFDENVTRKFTEQILQGVAYIHACNVIHRDIKGKNIMVMPNGMVKLIDFGCAKRLKNQNSFKDDSVKSMKGTPYWMAPEVIRESNYDFKADIWSIGATVIEMLTGQPPWGNLNPFAAIWHIGNGEKNIQLAEGYSEDAKDFVARCSTYDPSLRPTATELKLHKFITGNQENNSSN